MAMFDFLNDFGRPGDYGGILTPEQRDQAQMMSVLALAGPLLEAAGPSPVRRGIGSAFGKGITGMLQAQRAAVQDAMAQSLFPLQRQHLQTQVESAQQTMARQRAEDEAIQQAANSVAEYRPALPSAPEFGVGSPEALAGPQEAQGNPQLAAMIRGAGKPSLLELLKQRLGVGDTSGLTGVWATGPKGEDLLYQLSKLGGPPRQVQFPAGVNPNPGVGRLNLGGTEMLYNLRSGQPVQTIPKTLLPGEEPGIRRNQELGKQGADFIAKNFESATKAQDALTNINAAERILADQKLVTGWGANAALGFGNALAQVGVRFAGDPVTNTQTYMSLVMRQTVDLLGTKALGAGTGISDADRDFMQSASAGKITWTKEALQRAVAINKQIATNILAKHNDLMERMAKQGAEPSMLEPFRLQPSINRPLPTGGTGVKISTDAEYDALPSGTEFEGPDGIARRKP